MSNVSSSISTPGEARQARRIVLACDLAFVSQIIVIVALVLPTALLYLGSYLPGYALQLLMSRLGIAILAWLMCAASSLGVASAVLLLGAPRHMRCFRESCIYAALVIANSIVTGSGVVLPQYLYVVYQFASFILTPIALLFVLRKIALFLDSPNDIKQSYHVFRLLMIGIALFVIAQTATKLSFQWSLNPLIAVLITIGLFGSGLCAIVLVSMRLFSLNLSIRKQLHGKLEQYRQLHRSADSSSLVSSASQTASEPASSNFRRFVAWTVATVLVCVVCQALEYNQRSRQIANARKQQEAQADLREEQKQATLFNNELWERVRSPQATLKSDDISKMAALCKKYPSSAFYNTLGVAHYRSGNYEAAEQFLKISVAMGAALTRAKNGGLEPSDIAFLAMCSHKLGHRDKANAYREQFEKLMRQEQFKRDEIYQAFQQELIDLFMP